MRIVLGIIGMIVSLLLMKYREPAGDMIGEADWMRKVGGVYYFIVILALFFFFWSLAYTTNTLGFLFAPIRALFPGLNQAPVEGV